MFRLFCFSRSIKQTILLALVLMAGAALGLSGCSSMGGKGKGDGAEHFSDEDLALQQKEYGEGNIPEAAEGGLFADIHFDYNSSTVGEEYRDKLKQDAKTLMADPSLHAEIEGHCDKRGTNEFNLALGAERAKSAAKMLIEYGVNRNQVSTISYGEEIPLDPRDVEEAYAKNRRVHFALYRAKSTGQ
jgi:peptidoglycan-associated lipoprotein